jgi:hypothetical protein
MLRLFGVAAIVAIGGAIGQHLQQQPLRQMFQATSFTRQRARPSPATAHCRDGSESFSEHHQGTCSHHAESLIGIERQAANARQVNAAPVLFVFIFVYLVGGV